MAMLKEGYNSFLLDDETLKKQEMARKMREAAAKKAPTVAPAAKPVAPMYQAPPIDKNRAARANASKTANKGETASTSTTPTTADVAGVTVKAIDASRPASDGSSMADIGMSTASGALAGSSFGPYGAAIGAAAGTTIGVLQASAAKRRRQEEIENRKYQQLAQIEMGKNEAVQNAIANMAARLGSTLSTPVVRF